MSSSSLQAGNPFRKFHLIKTNPFGAIEVPVNVVHGEMLRKPENVSEELRRKFDAGEFKRISSNPTRHTLLRSRDFAIIGYHVPATFINGKGLTKRPKSLITNLPRLIPSKVKKNKETKRSVGNSRVYGCWNAYHADRKPHMSAPYVQDGERAQQFVDACKPLWDAAGEILKRVYPKTHRKYSIFKMEKGLNRLAVPWMCMSVNQGTSSDSVTTKEHKDGKDAKFGVSCVCPFGDYEGGELICWELEVIVELKLGDLFFFPAHLVTHSNMPVKGERHSLVAFMQQATIDYYEEKNGCIDDRKIRLEEEKQKNLKRQKTQ